MIPIQRWIRPKVGYPCCPRLSGEAASLPRESAGLPIFLPGTFLATGHGLQSPKGRFKRW